MTFVRFAAHPNVSKELHPTKTVSQYFYTQTGARQSTWEVARPALHMAKRLNSCNIQQRAGARLVGSPVGAAEMRNEEFVLKTLLERMKTLLVSQHTYLPCQ